MFSCRVSSSVLAYFDQERIVVVRPRTCRLDDVNRSCRHRRVASRGSQTSWFAVSVKCSRACVNDRHRNVGEPQRVCSDRASDQVVKLETVPGDDDAGAAALLRNAADRLGQDVERDLALLAGIALSAKTSRASARTRSPATTLAPVIVLTLTRGVTSPLMTVQPPPPCCVLY